MAETYKANGKEIICQDMTYGFLMAIQEGTIVESRHSVIENGTDLSYDDIMELRNSEVDDLYKIVTRLTYPDLFDKDGNQINFDAEEDESDSKKKVSLT